MIATKKALAKHTAEIDLAATLAEQPKPAAEEPIVPKQKRLRGRARASVAATLEGPSSKRPPKLAPGVKITRTYKGRKIVVLVRGDREFEYNGKVYRSLSKIACEISKSHCSGPRWFGIVGPKAKTPKKGGAR
jgi:Protein of unknown function (DUF2924)